VGTTIGKAPDMPSPRGRGGRRRRWRRRWWWGAS